MSRPRFSRRQRPTTWRPKFHSGSGIWLATWVLPVASPPIQDGAVAAREGTILSCGPADKVLAEHPDLRVRALGNVVLLPGLVDTHCHLEWSLMGGLLPSAGFGAWLTAFLPIRARMVPRDHTVAARLGALRALCSGTTTLADSGPTGAGVEAMTTGGLSGVVHLEAFGRESGDAAREAARMVAGQVAALDAEAGPGITVGVSPHAPYTVGPDFWRALADNAHLAPRSWATHLAESPDETSLLTDDTGPLAELFRANGWEPGRWPGPEPGTVSRMNHSGSLRTGLVAAHCVRLDAAEPAILAVAGVAVAHCPESNARLQCGRAPLEALLAAGVKVGIGTDSPASAGDYDVRAEARAAAREAKAARVPAPSAEALIRMATTGGAAALGMEALIGTLEAGKRCDLLAVALSDELHDDVYAAALNADNAVDTVVIAGVEVVRRGEPGYVDVEKTEQEARAARARIGRVTG